MAHYTEQITQRMAGFPQLRSMLPGESLSDSAAKALEVHDPMRRLQHVAKDEELNQLPFEMGWGPPVRGKQDPDLVQANSSDLNNASSKQFALEFAGCVEAICIASVQVEEPVEEPVQEPVHPQPRKSIQDFFSPQKCQVDLEEMLFDIPREYLSLVPPINNISKDEELHPPVFHMEGEQLTGASDDDNQVMFQNDEEPDQFHDNEDVNMRSEIGDQEDFQFTDAPVSNRGKKDRVWIARSTNHGRWEPASILVKPVRDALLKRFEDQVTSAVWVKKQWACWTDPINRRTHWNQCIAQGLKLRKGKHKPVDHVACEYCRKMGYLCAIIHEGAPDFVGILPLPPVLRQGLNKDDLEFWIA